MVVSTNNLVEASEFNILLNTTVSMLRVDAKRSPKTYTQLAGRKLENQVFEFMIESAKGTEFEGTIELVSGQKFPDIIANKYFGLEVKSTTQNHWTTTGNSVLESTRIPEIEKIYLLFGKLNLPVEFKVRKYEDCLSDIVVTHSPRYLINMELADGATIFNKLKMPYDDLRKLPSPIKPIINYYRKLLKPGDEVWWLDSNKPSSIIIKLWNNLTKEQKSQLFLKSFILFPEIFSSCQSKFNRLSVWLSSSENVICPNIRDVFTAGGKRNIRINKKTYTKIPRIVAHLLINIKQINSLMQKFPVEELKYYWGVSPKNRFVYWANQIKKQSNNLNLPFDLFEILTAIPPDIKILNGVSIDE